jgi:hypothetical protein
MIQTTPEQVQKMIYQMYPITKRERDCAIYKAKMEAKRDLLRKRIENEWQGKKEYQQDF